MRKNIVDCSTKKKLDKKWMFIVYIEKGVEIDEKKKCFMLN